MRICDLPPIAELADLPILSEDDPRTETLLKPDRFLEFAEAVDTVRLAELLHRERYEPVAIIRFGNDSAAVYCARTSPVMMLRRNSNQAARFLPRSPSWKALDVSPILDRRP